MAPMRLHTMSINEQNERQRGTEMGERTQGVECRGIISGKSVLVRRFVTSTAGARGRGAWKRVLARVCARNQRARQET